MTMRRYICVLIVSLISVDASGEDWPRWRGPRGDGTWNAPKLPATFPPDGPRRVWRREIGGGYAGVVVADGRVITMDRPTEPPERERVLCFDHDTGRTIWTHTYPAEYGDMAYDNGPRAAPTMFDSRVYTLGAVGHLYCLDAATGRAIWSRDTVRQDHARVPEWGYAASPLIDGDHVIVHVAATPNGCLLTLDRGTGKEVWRALDDPAGYATPVLIEHHGVRQLIAWTPENVHGLAPDNGKLLWSVPYKSTYNVSIATPIFRDNVLLVSGYWEGTKAIRLGPAPSDATVVWENNRHLRGLMSQPLYRNGYVYLLDKRDGLVCFDLKTGRKQWDDGNRLTPKDRNPQASLVWLNDDDRAMALNAEGELILFRLNPTGYYEQTRARIIGPTWSNPAYAGDRVYARDDHALVCVSLVTSSP